MPISVTVKTLDSQNHQIEGLDDEMTVTAFKEKIAPTVGVTPDCQRLIYCGRVLRDDKKLKEYGVNGKVIHLVQRNPNIPANGPDPVTASEARARGASPARGRGGHHHHIHIQQQPGYIPSMTFRLNVTRELLSLANHLISRLENPNAPPTPAPVVGSSRETGEAVGIAAAAIPSAGRPVVTATPEMGEGIPSQVAQAIQSAVNNAVQSMTSGAAGGRSLNIQPGHFEMSVSIDQNGQIISQSGPSRQSASSSGSTPTNNTASTTTTSSSGTSSTSQSSGATATQTSRQLQHPPLSELADAMDSLTQTEERFQPFRQQLYDLLRNDPTFEANQAQARQDAQQIFNRCTEVMHLLSHVQHALSDAVVDFSQNTPRQIRARPLVIQSRSTYFQSVPTTGRSASATRGTSGLTAASAATPTSASATSSSATQATSSSTTPRPMDVDHPSASHTVGEVEINVEPIIVGIEMEPAVTVAMGPPNGNGANGRATATNGVNVPQDFMNIFQSVLMNATRQNGSTTTSTSTSSSTSTTSSTTSSSTTTSETTSATANAATPPGSSTPARGGANTQPTTSTNTRSSAHVHYAPRGSMGFNLSPMMSSQPSFDPLLPCRSHHIDANSLNRRIRHPAGPLMQQRTRSASVPPRGNGVNPNNPTPDANRPETQASSARSSPSRRVPRPTTNVDFEVSTQIDVVPMIMTPQGVMGGVVAFGSPRTARPGVGAVGSQINAGLAAATGTTAMASDPVEPSLAALMGSLQSAVGGGGSDANDNANMVNGVFGIMNEIRNAVTAGGNQNTRVGPPGGGGDRRTISAYLESLPDYTYVAGESLLTDLLMLMARNTTFADLVSILMGSTESLNSLQPPLREFVRNYVLTPPNDDEEHDVDAAVLHLVDMSFPQFEEMAREANVRPDLDFAETLHSFMAANLSTLAETILSNSSPDDFGRQFRDRGNAFLTRLTILCLRCFVDGNVSLERVVRNRLEAVSGDVGEGQFREWILSAAVGHLRNYVAGINATRLQNEDIDQYLIQTPTDADQRKAARRRRLQQHQTREEETFVTPRSSPPNASPVSMEVDENTIAQATESQVQAEMSPVSVGALPPPSLADQRDFPSTLMSTGSIDSTISIGSQPWHGTVPSSWVPIMTRDISRQNGQEDQRPFSDAYISTQTAKRRRIASKAKPEGNVEQFIADTLDTSIRTSDVQPVNPVEEVIQETSSQVGLQESLRQNFQTNISRRINSDADFQPEKFPNSRDFAGQ